MPDIVSRRDLGSSNPIAKFFRQLGDSIKGIFTGLIFIVISFVLVWFMVTQKEHSKTIADLPLLTPTDVEGSSGMVKIQSDATYSNIYAAPNTDTDVLYYTETTEDYAVRKTTKTRVIQEDGREIEETYYVYEPKWKTVDTDTKWSDFKLGAIEIKPSKATNRFNSETFYENTEELEYNTFLSEEQLVDVPQKTRVTVRGVNSEDTLIVVGDLSGGVIASGVDGAFFISNMSDAEFIQAQEKSEKMKFWIMAGLAWLLMSSGFTMLFGPITHVLDIIPGLGELTKGLLGFIFGVLSAIIIFFAYIGLKFWWVFALVIIGLLGFQIVRQLKKADKKGGSEKKAEKSEK